MQAGQQFFDAKLLGPYAVHGRNKPVQHVVKALVFPGALERSDITRRLYHADGASVSPFVLADGAHFILCEILANFAAMNFCVRLFNGMCKAQGLFLLHAQHLIGKARGALSPNAGQFCKFFNQPL